MTTAFAFLSAEWPAVHEAASRAEAAAHPDPRTACFYARRALEIAVTWAYKSDAALHLPYQDNLSALVHEPSFKATAGQAAICLAVRRQRRRSRSMTPNRTLARFFVAGLGGALCALVIASDAHAQATSVPEPAATSTALEKGVKSAANVENDPEHEPEGPTERYSVAMTATGGVLTFLGGSFLIAGAIFAASRSTISVIASVAG